MTRTAGRMRPLATMPAATRRRIAWLFTDIDDTLTLDGRLPAASYAAVERLAAAGIAVVPITGRPAGWCDMIARFWPVAAVVGENGALWFSYDAGTRRMCRGYWQDEATRTRNRSALTKLGRRILAAVPEARISADQAYREIDLAIDFAEDVGPLPRATIDRIVALMERGGATAKISSIHAHAWFGDFDKLAMARRMMQERFGLDLGAMLPRCVFSGDAPNDEPMFRHFPNSVGVANVRAFADRLEHPPVYVTRGRGGKGFAELARAILAAR